MAGARGEGIIEAGGREVRVLFTNRALAEAEAQIGKSVVVVGREFLAGELSITNLAHLLQAGMQAAGRDDGTRRRPVSKAEVYEVLDAAGYAPVAGVVVGAVAAVLGHRGNGRGPTVIDGDSEDADPN